MSASSGEKGWCTSCPHALDQHTSAKFSKCKKCRKRFFICQCGLHGHTSDYRVNSTGWRICYCPCSCGKKYYPDAAKAATELEPWEYRLDHEAYRPVDDYFSEDATEQSLDSSASELRSEGEAEGQAGGHTSFENQREDEVQNEVVQDQPEDLTGQFDRLAIQDNDAAGPAGTSVYVDTYLKKGRHVFFTHNNVEYKTSDQEWEWHQGLDESRKATYHCECRRDGTTFWTYELPGAKSDEDYVETSGKGKGKGKRG